MENKEWLVNSAKFIAVIVVIYMVSSSINSEHEKNLVERYHEGYQDALHENEDDLREQGYEAGYDDGIIEGYRIGYERGSAAGVEAAIDYFRPDIWFADKNRYISDIYVPFNDDIP